jgi:serine/threonine protein kinase
MKRETFAEHYRIRLKDDGSPQELSRSGGAITYRAIDIRSGEAVAVQLIPRASVRPAAREQFEKQARAAQLLDHINIAKVFAFEIEDGNFVLVSELLEGETLDSWIAAHGSMSLDAVLRIALQGVSALNAASFHRLAHRAIQPSNLMIVPGPAAEGGWPLVKLINFGLAGFNLDSDSGGKRDTRFGSPEELQCGIVDFRSEIYSLGATMHFLLTGTTPGRHFTGFPKRVGNLLGRMLHNNPDKRPQDPVGFAEEIRECLLRVERREALTRRVAIPLQLIISRIGERPRIRWVRLPRRKLAVAALVLTVTALAAILFAEPVRMILHRNSSAKTIGVPVGVPEDSSLTNPVPDQANTPVVAAKSPAPTAQLPEKLSAQAAGSVVEQKPPIQIAKAEAKVESREAVRESGTNGKKDANESSATALKNSGKAQAVARRGERRSSNIAKRGRIASETPNESEAMARLPRRGSGRAEFLGVRPDGSWILRLPSGQTAVMAP